MSKFKRGDQVQSTNTADEPVFSGTVVAVDVEQSATIVEVASGKDRRLYAESDLTKRKGRV